MMRLLSAIFGAFTSNTGEKLVELALEKTEDVDKRNALVLDALRIREGTRIAEINRVTIPWVDALHKMGRQLLVAVLAVGTFVCIALGHVEDLLKVQDWLLAVATMGGIYIAMKGRGQ